MFIYWIIFVLILILLQVFYNVMMITYGSINMFFSLKGEALCTNSGFGLFRTILHIN